MSDTTIAPMQRAGFWRRAFCWMIDAFLVALLLQFLGIFAFSVTGGVVQSSVVAIPMLSGLSCGQSDYSHHQDEYSNGDITKKTVCEIRPFGFLQTRLVIERKYDAQGKVTATKARRIDTNGDDASAFDWLYLLTPTFFLYRTLTESRGNRTPGRHLTKIRLVAQDGSTPGSRQIAKRYSIQLLPLVLPPILNLALSASFTGKSPNLAMWAATTLFTFDAAVLAMALWAMIDIVRRRDAFYDRAAGACVINDP